MKERALLGFAVSLAILSIGSFTTANSQMATRRPILAQRTGRPKPVAEVFRSIFPQLKQQTRVPILLPSELFGRQGERFYASGRGDANGYRIVLGTVPNCNAEACYVGFFSAKRGDRPNSDGKPVRLARGITGYFSPTKYREPSQIEWLYGGVLYTIQMRVSRNASEAQATMIRLANSAIEVGLQDSQIATGRSPNTGQQTTTGRSQTPGRSPTRTASGQELVASNLGCTSNFRTSLGQSAPDYCTSSEANSGILFDRFQVSRNPDRSIKLEMRVFNRGSADGLVEVYDSKGRLKNIKIIDGNIPPTGLIQSGRDLFTKVPASFFSRYPLDDSRRDLKEQNISVTIPNGGAVKITKSSNTARLYNTAMLAVEVAQIAQGDPEFTKQESVRKFVSEFAKEAYFSRNSEAVINIFKSEPSAQAIFSLDFIDRKKLAEVLQKLLQYSVTIESDPSKNPLIGAFQDLYLEGANIGIEKALDKYILPGLGTVARIVRRGGNAVNTFARAADLSNTTLAGEKATVTLRDAASTRAN